MLDVQDAKDRRERIVEAAIDQARRLAMSAAEPKVLAPETNKSE